MADQSFSGSPNLDPPFSRADYTWKTDVKPTEYENEPIYLIEAGSEKYLYDDIMACRKDMITFDEPVYIYRYDPTHQRYSHYVVIEQPEESK